MRTRPSRARRVLTDSEEEEEADNDDIDDNEVNDDNNDKESANQADDRPVSNTDDLPASRDKQTSADNASSPANSTVKNETTV